MKLTVELDLFIYETDWREMRSENLHILHKILTFSSVSLLFMFIVSGCLNSEPPPPPGQQIETSTEKKEDISQEAKIEFENDTGIVVKDITIKPKGTLGGDIVFLVQNESVCHRMMRSHGLDDFHVQLFLVMF